MQSRDNRLRLFDVWLIAVTVLLLCTEGLKSQAQNILNPTTALKRSAAPFEPTSTPSTVSRKLKQWDALIADKAWDEAFDLLERLQTEQGTQWIETAPSSDHFHTLAQACQQLLAKLPAEGLTNYRQRVDSSAESLLEEGLEHLDPAPLNQLISEYFASSYGDQALLALGEIAFAQGDMVAARRAWLRIDSRLMGPFGKPIDQALSDIDPDADPKLLAQLWLEAPRPVDLNTYPASEIPLTDLLARLVMTSLQEKQFGRALAELRLLEAIAPEQSGWIAGREQPLARSLRSLYESALLIDRSEASSRSGTIDALAWQWPQSLEFTSTLRPSNQQRLQRVIRLNGNGQRIQFWQPISQQVAITKPTHYPVVSNDIVALVTKEGLKGWDLNNGNPIAANRLGQQNVAAQAVPNRVSTLQRRIVNGRVVITNSRAASGVSRTQTNAAWPGSLTAWKNQFLFTSRPLINSLSRTNRRRINTPSRLLGISPQQDGKVVLELSSSEVSQTIDYHYAGPPTVRGDQLYIVLSNLSARRELAVACYSISLNRLEWITPIGSAEGGLNPQQYVTMRVELANDTAYLATDQGAVVALHATTGKVRWLTRYPRNAQDAYLSNQGLPARQPILDGDRLYLRPRDSKFALALNTGTGRIVWTGEPTDPKSRLVAVTPRTILFAGEQVEGIDPTTGRRRYLFPDSKHAGIRGKGEGITVGKEYYWPTRNEIRVFDIDTGVPTRLPIDLMPVGSQGAILAQAGDRIVVAGPTKMNVLGEESFENLEPIPQLSRLMERRQATRGQLLSKNSIKITTP